MRKPKPLNSRLIYTFFSFVFLLISFQQVSGQILNYETKITIEKDGTKITNKTIRVQINDKQSNWLSHVEVDHNPMQDFSFNYAHIIDADGNIVRKLKKREYITKSDMSNQAFYQDGLITEFDLYWNKYPYQIEYSYTVIEDEFLYVTGWTPIVYTNVPTVNSSLEIDIPADYPIHINQFGDIISSNETREEDRIKYKWQASEVKKLKTELYPPPIRELIPVVMIVPSNFKYGIDGSSSSWASFGTWLDKLNEGTDQLPLKEKAIIEKLVEGMDDKREIIKTIYYYLQDHTKYINVAIDVGGMKSYPAGYVCQNKYGDCKALTTYMKAMLKSVNIESYYTVINAGKNEAKVQKDFPGQQFNHVVLAVPMENDTIWLENTSNILPFNYLGTFTQNRYALAVNEEKSELIRTPELQPSDVLSQRHYEFFINGDNKWRGNVKLDLRGNDFEDFRYFIRNRNEKDQKSQLLQHIDIREFNLDHWNIIDENRDHTNLVMDISGNFPSQIRKIGKWEVINPLRIAIPDFERPQDRKLNVRLNFPINRLDKSVYHINDLNDKKVQLPEEIELKSSYGQYSTVYLQKNDSIQVNEEFTLTRNDIGIEEYPAFYAFIKSIIDYKKKSAILLQ